MTKAHPFLTLLVSMMIWAFAAPSIKADTIMLSGTFNTTFTANCLNATCSKFEAPYTGTGTITINGSTLTNVAVSSFQVVDFSLAVPNLTGTITFTAANGDKLFANASGVPSPPVNGTASLVGAVFTITGGTGVFANLTGTLPIVSGSATFTSQTGGIGQFTFTGTAAPVPEPSTLFLLGTGLSGIGTWARKRRRSNKK
jgi:hypothetical protein